MAQKTPSANLPTLHSTVQGLIRDSRDGLLQKLHNLGPDQFELYFERRTSTSIDVKDKTVDSLTRAEDIGLSIRFLKDKRMGFSFTTSLHPEAIDRAIQAAASMAQVLPEDELQQLQSFSNFVYPAVDQWDAKGIERPLDHKIELARKLEAACRSADARITGIRKASVSEVLGEAALVDSNGEILHHHQTLFTAGITCKSEQGGESQVGHEFEFSNDLDTLDTQKVGLQAAKLATELLGAKQPASMQCPAVFRNSVVAELLDFLSSSFSAEAIDKGQSIFCAEAGAAKFGERLFSERITLCDDGLLPGGYATGPFDGEGVPSQRTTLVDGGFLQAALYNTYYARKADKPPTGNSSRGIKSPPTIATTNFFMQPGKKTPEQLLQGIKKGVLITDLMAMHTANPVTGDFSLGASGILIENERLTQPVRGFAVAGNVLELLRRTTEIGSDLRFFGGTGAPSIRVSEISVGGC